jgi:predicted phosphate transport protein (TIGR00153 family)
MFTRFIRAMLPREENFVANFVKHADCMVRGVRALKAMMNAAPAERDPWFRQVCSIEGEADSIARDTLIGLHRAFLTPFDRSDIHALITAQDNALDTVEDVAQRATLYGVVEYSPNMLELAERIEQSALLLAEAIPLLSDVSRNAEAINAACVKVGRIESEADRILRQALSELFSAPPDPVALVSRKEIYELLESVTDRLDDVGDVIEGIVLDHV